MRLPKAQEKLENFSLRIACSFVSNQHLVESCPKEGFQGYVCEWSIEMAKKLIEKLDRELVDG